MNFFRGLFLSLNVLWFASLTASANPNQFLSSHEQPPELQKIGIQEKLGAQLDTSLVVRNEKNEMVPLKSFFNGKTPVIFSLVYYSCPGLCNLHLNGLIEGLREMDWSAGQKFEVVALSFDSTETAQLATDKKASYMKEYRRSGTENGFHFLTADEATIKKITETVGFDYRWDDKAKEWSHASAAIMLTPEGKVARYLHGILFDQATLKLALGEAGEGKIGTIVDKLVWYCFRYDPKTSQYTLVAHRLMQLGGGLIIVFLAMILVPFWMRARRQELSLRQGET